MRHVSLVSGRSPQAALALGAVRAQLAAQTASWGAASIANKDGTRTYIGPGGVVLGSSADLDWLTASGSFSLRSLSMQLSQVQKTLSDGGVVQNGSRRNTISLSAPDSADGFPEGAFWTRVESAESLVAVGVWKVVDGTWVEQDLGAATLISPTMDAGLIDAAAVAARLIVSGEMWSSKGNPRFGMTSGGFVGYDEAAQETVHVDGRDNFLYGTSSLGRIVFKRWASPPGTRWMDAPDTERWGSMAGSWGSPPSYGAPITWRYSIPGAKWSDVDPEATWASIGRERI